MGHASIWLGHVLSILYMECSNRYGTCPKWFFDGTCLDMVGTCPTYFSMEMLQSIWDMYQWGVRWDMPRYGWDMSSVFCTWNVPIGMEHVPNGFSMGHALIWLGHVRLIFQWKCYNPYGTCTNGVFDGTCLDMVGICPMEFSCHISQNTGTCPNDRWYCDIYQMYMCRFGTCKYWVVTYDIGTYT